MHVRITAALCLYTFQSRVTNAYEYEEVEAVEGMQVLYSLHLCQKKFL
jgi:hypothetical protein